MLCVRRVADTPWDADARVEGGVPKSSASSGIDQVVIRIESEFERLMAPLREVRGELLAELQRLETVRSQLEESLEHVEGILRAAEPELTDNKLGRRLRGVAAVRAVLQEDPAREWRPRDLHAELGARGWQSRTGGEAAVTQAALHRLLTRGEVDRTAPGLYRWKGGATGSTT
jgi:hypothetical protein